MKRSRRKFSSKFKTKVVLEVLKECETVQQIAARHEIHPNQISMCVTRQHNSDCRYPKNSDSKFNE